MVQRSPLHSLRLARARQLTSSELEALYYVHDRCAQMLTETLSVDPVSAAQWQLIAAEERSLGAVLQQTDPESVWAFMDFGESLVGAMALVFRKETVLSMVHGSGADGGHGAQAAQVGEYELSLLENKIQHFTDSFSMAWADYYQITPNTKASITPHTPPLEQLRTLLPNVGPNSIVAVMTFRVLMVAREPQECMLIFPQPYLEPLAGAFKAILESIRIEADPEQMEQRVMSVDSVTTPVVVELGTTTMTVSEIQKLEVGHFVRLDQQIEEPLVVRIASYRKLRGRPGLAPDMMHLAVQVVKP